MKFIKTLFWHSFLAAFAITPCLSKDNPLMNELKSTKRFMQHQQEQGNSKSLLITPQIMPQTEPVKKETVSTPSPISHPVTGMEGLFSSESINILLVGGVFCTKEFEEPLRFRTKEGVDITTSVIEITIGSNPQFKEKRKATIGVIDQSHTAKTFKSRVEFKNWVAELLKNSDQL